MELIITIDISELLDKSKEIDLAKLLEMYQDIQAGKQVHLFNNAIKIQKAQQGVIQHDQ